MKFTKCSIFVLRDNSGKYLFYVVQSFKLASLNVGSAVPSMTSELLNNLLLILPSKEILKNYAEITSSMFAKVEHNNTENQHLTALRDWLLPMLMNGQVLVG